MLFRLFASDDVAVMPVAVPTSILPSPPVTPSDAYPDGAVVVALM